MHSWDVFFLKDKCKTIHLVFIHQCCYGKKNCNILSLLATNPLCFTLHNKTAYDYLKFLLICAYVVIEQTIHV